MGDILRFLTQDDRGSDRLSAMLDLDTDAVALARSLGSPDEWAASAVSYLKAQSTSKQGLTAGAAIVSRASLHVVLDYVERLEARLGLGDYPGGAA